MNYSSIVFLLDGLLGDIDTIEEFTVILVTNVTRLGDKSAREGEVLVVDSIEDKLVLDVLGESDSATREEFGEEVVLSTQEVLHLNRLVGIGSLVGDGNIDGEMSVDKSHLVLEAL